MVKNRLAQPDAVESGWLLDGYPRSAEQAEAIEQASIRPDLFLLINVRGHLLGNAWPEHLHMIIHGWASTLVATACASQVSCSCEERQVGTLYWACKLDPQVPDELLVERIVGRRSDPETGAIYHLTFRPPPEDVLHRLVQRSDDTEEMVRCLACVTVVILRTDQLPSQEGSEQLRKRNRCGHRLSTGCRRTTTT